MVNMVYCIGSILIFGLIYLNYKNKCNTQYWVCIYLFIRNGIRLLDLENTRAVNSSASWAALISLQVGALIVTASVMGSCFPNTSAHKVIMLTLIPMASFFMFCGVVGFQEFVAEPQIILKTTTMVIPIGVTCFVLHLMLVQKINVE